MGFYWVGPGLWEGRGGGAEIQLRCHGDLTEGGVGRGGAGPRQLESHFDSEVIENDGWRFNLSFN